MFSKLGGVLGKGDRRRTEAPPWAAAFGRLLREGRTLGFVERDALYRAFRLRLEIEEREWKLKSDVLFSYFCFKMVVGSVRLVVTSVTNPGHLSPFKG